MTDEEYFNWEKEILENLSKEALVDLVIKTHKALQKANDAHQRTLFLWGSDIRNFYANDHRPRHSYLPSWLLSFFSLKR